MYIIYKEPMKPFFVCTLLLILLCAFGFSEEPSDVYGTITDLFTNLDPNTGLTAFPTLWIPMGGKYEGMATAYTAVADDIGFLEANPSASSVLSYTELAFLHNDWIADSNMEGAVYTMRINDLGFGIGGKFLYVPFTEYDRWGERVSKGYYSETVGTINASYNFFSSYYFYGIAVGANIKIAYRNVPESIYANQSALMAMTDIGVLTRFNFLKFYASRDKNFSVGAVLKNLGPDALGDPLPTETTVGIAYSPIRPLTIAFDLNIPISFSPDTNPPEQVGFAGGIDVVFTTFFSLHGGFLLRGTNPRISMGGTIDLEKISFIVNYTLDFTTQLGSIDRFSIGAKLNLGDRGRAEQQRRLDELYVTGLEEYANGNIEQAIALWEEAIHIDSDFQPVLEMLKTAREALALQKEMESIEQVE